MKKYMLQLKAKSANELARDLGDLRMKLSALRFDLAHGKVKNPQEIRLAKKTIARMLTLLKQKSRIEM